MSERQLQEAKARFSELVKRARDEGPQTVTVHGERAAVVVSAAEDDRLVQPALTVLDVLGSVLDLPDDIWSIIEYRDKTPARDFEWCGLSQILASFRTCGRFWRVRPAGWRGRRCPTCSSASSRWARSGAAP